MEFLWGRNILFQKFLSKPMLDLNNVSVKFQLDWPANHRIIAGSFFSRFRVFVFQLLKMFQNTVVVVKATKFLYLEDES